MGLIVTHSGPQYVGLRDGCFGQTRRLASGLIFHSQRSCDVHFFDVQWHARFAVARGCRWRNQRRNLLARDESNSSRSPITYTFAVPGSNGISSSGKGGDGSSSSSIKGENNRSLTENNAVDTAGGGGAQSDAMSASPSSAASAAVAASSVAAAAVVGAVAFATVPPPPPKTSALRLLQRAVTLLRSHFVAVLLLYAGKDAVAFLLHRVAQRLTNHAAEMLLGAPTSTAGNPWWLYLDAAFFRANPGYEVLVGLGFLACLPLNIALNSATVATVALVCTPPELRKKLAAAAAASSAGSSPSSPLAARGGQGTPAMGPGAQARGGRVRRADDPAAAALADLGIHALPTPPAPSEEPPPLTLTPPSPSLSSLSSSSSSSSLSSSSGSHSDALAAEDPLFAPASTNAAAATVGGAAPPTGGKDGGGSGGMGASSDSREAKGPLDALRSVLGAMGAVLPEAAAMLRRVWWVDLQFTARALPLQGLCLLVLPALWALPRLLRIQLALPAAVLEGQTGTDALKRSTGLMASSLVAYGTPFAVLLAAGRLLEYVQGVAMALIPPRWWREVVEVPLAIAGAFLIFKAAIHRLQDLLPLATFLELQGEEAQAAAKHKQQLLQEQVMLQMQTDRGPQQHHQESRAHGEQQQQHRKPNGPSTEPLSTTHSGAARNPPNGASAVAAAESASEPAGTGTGG